MAQALQAIVKLEDYLAAEDTSAVRHEYLGGRVYAMVGGSLRHNLIASSISRLLFERFRGSRCHVFMSDVKLHVKAADTVYYPDVVLCCTATLGLGDKMIDNAELIVEVTSGSTASVDRREKLVAYQKLAGVRAYWIVSQNEQQVEVHERDAGGPWRRTIYGRGEALSLAWLDAEPIALADIYQGLDVL